MEVYWYIMIALVFIAFFILDGYDFGVGIIHLFFAEKEKDKELITKAAGLFWDSNEVWFVVAGGLTFMAFPLYYASVFSGFYLPLIIVLWLMIFRAIGLELRGQFHFQMWRDIWDKAFGVSSLLLALFYGCALGNVVRGVNLGGVENGELTLEKNYFFAPLWNSEFSPLSTHPGVIDWFTIIIGVIAVVVLMIHGANWVVLKTNSSINKKLKGIVFKFTIIQTLLTALSLFLWPKVKPDCYENFFEKPYLLIFPIIYTIGLIGLYFVKKFKDEKTSFIFSILLIFGGISSSLASLFPVILPSVNKIHEDLTIYNTSTDAYEFSYALVWSIIGFLSFIVFMIIQIRLTSGKIDKMEYGH